MINCSWLAIKGVKIDSAASEPYARGDCMKQERYEVYMTLNGRIFKKVQIDKKSKLFDQLVNM